MLVVAGVLGVLRLVRPDVEPPTADVPAVGWEDVRNDDPTQEPADEPAEDPIDEPPEETTGEPAAEPLPTSYNLAVPFTSQAPQGVWDALHEDACEEASIYMVIEYFDGVGDRKIDPVVADTAITAVVNYAQSELDHGLSIHADAAVELIEAYYPDYNARIVENPTIDELKQYVADGYPVIVPAAGRELGNPFFTGEGPLYHMLVIRGYDETRFITNDPGTRHGQNYAYTYSVLMSAMGDWNNGDPANGESRVIIIQPK